MDSQTNTEFKDKVKRQSKGMRKYIRRMKQAKRRESTFMVPKKKKNRPGEQPFINIGSMHGDD